MFEINYTIIIPHKNCVSLLQFCLDSIPIRDDVQVIVVDDNSDRNKVNFESFPRWNGKNYENYFTKEGKGAGYARNVGLEHAKGKWIIFSDADDYFLSSFDDVLNENISSNADITFFRPQSVMLKDRKTHSLRSDFYNRLIDNALETGDTNQLVLFWMSPCSKIIRSDIVDGLKFEEIQYSNDNVFSVSVACKAKIIEVRDKSFYMITQGDNSLTSNFLNKRGELECRSGAFLRVFYVAKSMGKDVRFYYEALINYAHKLHGRNWKLYTEYMYCLKNEGIGFRQMLKVQYREKNILHRWIGYFNTVFHLSVCRMVAFRPRYL